MPVVELSDQEWGEAMAIISEAPWRRANPLLMKIGEQLRQQYQPPNKQSAPPGGGVRIEVPPDLNSGKEAAS
jgi:hypothetical protein